MKVTGEIVVHIPDTRGVVISPFGSGNLKIGPGIYTYSKLPGRPTEAALGSPHRLTVLQGDHDARSVMGTCPGATPECVTICYAQRPVAEQGVVYQMWQGNTMREADVPDPPADAVLIRLHISGDFDSVAYIERWTQILKERPHLTAWAYTKSWRVPALRPALERLRALPNMQMFGSMDASALDDPNHDPHCAVCGMESTNPQHSVHCPDDAGAHDFVAVEPWRRAWIYRPVSTPGFPAEERLSGLPGMIGSKAGKLNYTHTAYMHLAARPLSVDEQIVKLAAGQPITVTTPSYVCPEQTGYKKNCLECGYCFEGQRNDVTFLEH